MTEAFSEAAARPRVHIIFVPWLIPGWARAQVWGRCILIRRGVAVTETLLAHELAHVQQWRTLGVLRFVWRYGRALWQHGYWHHPMERAARAAEIDPYYRQWARIVRQEQGIA